MRDGDANEDEDEKNDEINYERLECLWDTLGSKYDDDIGVTQVEIGDELSEWVDCVESVGSVVKGNVNVLASVNFNQLTSTDGKTANFIMSLFQLPNTIACTIEL
ncbi:hypothetical protein Tco_1407356 [Tanacetum coccineum]